MKLGIWAPRGGKADEIGIDDPYGNAVEVVQRAEALGFATTLVAQRWMGDDLEAWILAAALAPQTSTIELMVAVHPGIVTPQVAAKMGATLDRLSNGRFAVNLVNGWWREEIDQFGNGAWLDRSDARYRRMDEFTQVLLGLWGKEPFQFGGEFFRVDPAFHLQVVQSPHPPLYAASRSEPGKDSIAQRCNTWFAYYEPGHRKFEASFAAMKADVEAMRARAASYGRALSFGISAMIVCGDTQAEAEAEADAIEAGLATRRVGASSVNALGAGLVGTPEEIVERMRRYEAIGVDCFMLRFPQMLPGVEEFGARIAPLLSSVAERVQAL